MTYIERPGWTPRPMLVSTLINLIKNCVPVGEFSHKIIMGYLEADLLKTDDPETKALLNLVENHSLKIGKHGAIHHRRTTTTKSDTHIEVILVDAQDRLLDFD